MKINLKELLIYVFCLFTCFCYFPKTSAAEYNTYDNSTHSITLNQTELDSLRKIGGSISTIDDRYTITNVGCPKNISVAFLPECYLFQVDFMRPITAPKIPKTYNGITFMNVTLSNEIYGSSSIANSWNCIFIHDHKTDQTSLFKVCVSLKPSTS